MDQMDLMRTRHSVRQYSTQRIEPEKRAALEQLVSEINAESGLHVQAFFDEPQCFNSFMAHYGKFSNVSNYFALVGEKRLEECAGYYGEKLVLKCQELGLNTCWVAMTHGKSKAVVKGGEKQLILISLGYGVTQGVPHKSKEISQLSRADSAPEWFTKGMEAVCLAPTAMNQQKFLFTLKDGVVTAEAMRGFYTKIDLGIAKYHFETISGHPVK